MSFKFLQGLDCDTRIIVYELRYECWIEVTPASEATVDILAENIVLILLCYDILAC